MDPSNYDSSEMNQEELDDYSRACNDQDDYSFDDFEAENFQYGHGD